MCRKNEKFDKCMQFSEIKNSLTGYGRFTYYNYDVITLKEGEVWTNASSDQKYAEYHRVVSIQEGQFHCGLMNGFARQFEANGDCKIGFWKPIKMESKKKVKKVVHQNEEYV